MGEYWFPGLKNRGDVLATIGYILGFGGWPVTIFDASLAFSMITAGGVFTLLGSLEFFLYAIGRGNPHEMEGEDNLGTNCLWHVFLGLGFSFVGISGYLIYGQ